MSLLSRLAVQAARAYGILSSRSNNISADYLVVAGGGGGGKNLGGGGGAGGYQTSTATLSTLVTYTVTVGAGGSANSGNGNNSVLSGTGLTTITSTGGGGGGSANTGPSGQNGGSGGGGGGVNNTTAGTGTSGQGNAGGIGGGTGGGNQGTGGGGGGAGAAGQNWQSGTQPGNGGNGSASSISGSSVTYAGGGAGGADGTGTATGGTGGGGNSTSGTGNPGTANTGGGGAGGNGTSNNGGAGGSGIVIISYTSATPKFVGGTITTSGGKQIHTFTSSGTLSPITPITASYLVVAGGGGGGSTGGGGGGAGGLLTSSTTLYSGATYVVTVGAGGANAASESIGNTSGGNSVISGTGLTTITATGGGRGSCSGGASNAAETGGSGGGGGMDSTANRNLGAAGTSGQGNAGGNGFQTTSASNGAGGGGGGASAAGANTNGSGTQGGNGGNGTASSISGSSVTYAGGGGGGLRPAGTPASGGSGGGGTGGHASTLPSGGTANTGGGGGGGGTTASGAGGSGIVIISYAGSQAFNGGLVTTSGGNTIHTFTSTGALTPLTNNLNNSLRFRSSANAYLSRTPTLATNRRTWTYSFWAKISTTTNNPVLSVDGASSTDRFHLGFGWTNPIEIFDRQGSVNNIVLETTQVFRDPSAWYHCVVAVDTTQATSSNRVKIYINGNQVTAFNTATYPSQNYETLVNATKLHQIARETSNGSQLNVMDGYMADINFIDGQALEPYYFGNNDANGVWKPIQYKGTYGTNGFYLNFADTSALTTSSNAGLGKDTSGNGNYWTTNNISITSGSTYDAMLDVPTNTSATVANYCVMNPLQRTAGGAAPTSANLKWAAGIADWYTCFATIGVSSGKYYWEVTNTNLTSSSTYTTIGISKAVTVNAAGTNIGSDADSYVYYSQNGNKINNGSQVAYGNSYVSNDIVGVALDLDNGKLFFSKNGTWQASGDPAAGTNAAYTGLSGTFQPAISELNSTIDINFGQRPFSYTPPTGYVALNTYNLPTPTILQGNKYMDATLYTGTGTTQVVVNQGQFKPDFVWIKSRVNNPSGGALNHELTDSVRGATKELNSNNTGAETTNSAGLTAFNSNGFTVGGDYNYNNPGNGGAMVGWQWQAGQGSSSSNTSGSITSTVSVNTTAGFSIVTYTGTGANATVGHGLGVAPAMMIIKQRNSAQSWSVYHASLGATKRLYLDLTDAVETTTTAWNSTAPTSTVYSVGTSAATNSNGGTFVAYCWAAISGFSAFGSYTGNGSTDGPFVFTGFRPKYLLVKITDTAGYSWNVVDSSRNTYNVANLRLMPNLSNAEDSGSINFDLLSNGFKVRDAGIGINQSGSNYIYAAFAENPFKNSNAR